MKNLVTAHLLLQLSVLLSSVVNGFYLPGVAPQSWNDGDKVQVEVDALTSPKTRLPYDFYDFPFCRPKKGVVAHGETLGEIFAGMRTESTEYDIAMNENFNCKVLCKVTLNKEEILKMKKLIDEQYVINLMIDNLPGAMEMNNDYGGGGGGGGSNSNDQIQFGLGFWVGGIILDQNDENIDSPFNQNSVLQLAKKSKTAPRYINNHIVFKLFYHVPTNTISPYVSDINDPTLFTEATEKNIDGTNAKRIVRFEVHPYSIKHVYDKQAKKFNVDTVQTCKKDSKVFGEIGNGQNMLLEVEENEMNVVYTYGVEWISSPTSWSTRWDIYLSMGGQTHDDIHWLSITNSILVAVFLTALVALILVRTLRKDLMRYNRIPTDEEKAEELEESGWKLVHGDVFRPPTKPLLFSVVVGSGIQCFWMSFTTICFAAFGFLSPANRGSFITAFLVLFILLGAVGGFYSARIYKTLNGTGYQATTFLTAFGFPGIIFAGFFIINLFVWGYGSSAALPFTSMLAICALWFGISVPLTFLGAFIGYGRDAYEHPTRVNTLPRQIPELPFYMTTFMSILIGGR